MVKSEPLAIACLAGGVFLGLGWVGYARRPLLALDHAPVVVSRRSGALAACVTGAAHPFVHRVEFRVNQGEWHRAEPGRLVLALPAAELVAGSNRLELRALAWLRGGERRDLVFDYDASQVRLPIVLGESDELEVLAGSWERLTGGDGPRLRPRGSGAGENVLLASGSFAGGRRVAASLLLRQAPLEGPWEFGVMLMAGGPVGRGERAEATAVYRSEWQGLGGAFRLDLAGQKPLWTHVCRDFTPRRGVRYELIAECCLAPAPDGERARHVLRCKWWPRGEPQPEDWMEVSDDEGAPLPMGDYGVALVARGCVVEFSGVRVEPLPPR